MLKSTIKIVLLLCSALLASAWCAADEPSFVLGINLNGPSVVIDGQKWLGQDSDRYECVDKAFENPLVKLIPPTDAARAKMIRSSRWGGNRVLVKDLPAGELTLFLYVWEDNASETYDVMVNGQYRLRAHQSGKAGSWDRLGPWSVEAENGQLEILSRGGAANFSGIEIWKGHFEGLMKSEVSAEDLAFFEKRIRPILVNHCYECHSVQSESVDGELLLDSMVALRRGGSNGPAIVPGDPDSSLIMKAMRYRHSQLQMPPAGRLDDAILKDFEEWIARGAADPRTEATEFQRKAFDYSAAKDHWAFRPLGRPRTPAIQHVNWPRNEMDCFVLAKMEENGFAPHVDADRRTWIRRATFDLHGLPPTPEEVTAFVDDATPDAYSKVVDRLLDSPRYGERWGRYWLDVVRYADTAGDNSDFPIPQMHLYRDWVIDSFNQDLPYDRFVRLQLAGDLMPYDSDEQRRKQNIATGYIANARRFGSRVDDYPQHLTIEDTIDNFGRAFLGLTVNCSRCHDHKFDPISTEDYYGLYGIFDSTRYPWPGIELDQRQRDLVAIASEGEVSEFEKGKAEMERSLEARIKHLQEELKKASESEKDRLEKELKDAKDAARIQSQSVPPYEMIYGVAESSSPHDVAIQLKGDPAKPGDKVPRRFLTVLGGQTLTAGDSGSGRRELADWLLDPNNPLPARVMVNRIWHYHFGKGIVPTPNDFGKQGKPPSHPELLDWLAVHWMEQGWSIKALHRTIMLSHTYRLASRTRSSRDDPRNPVDLQMLAQAASDPANTWISAYPRRRLDAEALRDSLLLLGQSLDESPAGPHPFPPQNEWKFTQHNPFKAEYASRHRSVFLMTQRIQRHSYLAIFDGADPSTSTPQRPTTTTPVQSLFLLNDSLVHEQAERFADRLEALAKTFDWSEKQRIDYAFQLCMSRSPSDDEMKIALEYLEESQSQFDGLSASEREHLREPRRLAWQSFARVLFRLNEFITID